MVIKWYQAKLAKRPILTQAVMSAVLFATGDTLAQQAVEKKGFRNQDLMRTGRMGLYGGCVFGPGAAKWYQFLQNKIKLENHNTTIAARVLADQTIFATCNMAFFLSSMSVMEGSDPKEKLKKNYINGLKANWMVWPPVQAINFKLVPLEHRVLVVNVGCACREAASLFGEDHISSTLQIGNLTPLSHLSLPAPVQG